MSIFYLVIVIFLRNKKLKKVHFGPQESNDQKSFKRYQILRLDKY